MITKCMMCGLKLSNGMPTPEMMSRAQANFLDTEFVGDPANILSGTIYHDLTVHNFCTFCLQAIVSFKEVFSDSVEIVAFKHMPRSRVTEDIHGMECTVCHQKFIEIDVDGKYHMTWVRLNRRMIMHRVEHTNNWHPLDMFRLQTLLEIQQ